VVHYGLKEVTYFGLLLGLVFGRIEPKEFMAQISQLLDAAQQPVLEDFLMRNLSFLHDCLTTGELSLESILTPSAGKPFIAEAVELTGQTCSIQQGPTTQDAGSHSSNTIPTLIKDHLLSSSY
jgi:hypothetical protein